jgi:putative DNA primase/helicase
VSAPERGATAAERSPTASAAFDYCAPATVEAADEDISTLDFLRKILPSTGLYIIARLIDGKWKHTVCDSLEEAAAYALQYDAQGVATYHANSAFREPWVEDIRPDGKVWKRQRVQRNVRAVKAFWADLDVDPKKPEKYVDQEDAIDGLKSFCTASGLPIPWVVSSGRGIHVYWTLTNEIGPDQWKQTAEAFKALAARLKFKIDYQCSADSSRVLRPIGTWNRKDPSNPCAVELIVDAEDLDYAAFHKLVTQALAKQGIKAPDTVKKRETSTEHVNADFAVKQSFPLCSAVKVAERCPQLAKVRDNIATVSEPHFYAAVQLLCNAVEGDQLIHEWASRFPNYDPASGWVDQKIHQIRSQGVGPTLCSTFESRNPGGCDACPFRGKISSPAQLGHLQIDDIPLSSRVEEAPAVDADAVAASAESLPSATSAAPNAGRVETAPAQPITPVIVPSLGFGAQSQEDAQALAVVMHAPNEDNVGRLFERRYSDELRYCKTWGTWLVWDGARWQPERTDLAFHFARQLAREANPAGKANISKAAFANGVEKFARAARTFATESGDWDRDELLLNTPGGTVDLRTGKIRPHDRRDQITNVTQVTPQDGPKPAFDRFMREITLGDTSLIEYHQRSLGAALSGAIADHWLLFWIGAGRNGKNTLGDLIAWIVGDYAKTILSETLMSTKAQSHPTELANLRGVRLAISSEVAEGAYWNETRIKSLTGDTTISARFMKQDYFEFARTHKHLIYGNHRPMLRVVDDAIRARMHIVPFRATFSDELGNRDPLLPEKLRAEAPQILTWLIEGHAQWVQDGYTLKPCAAVQQETKDYLDTQSTPTLWIAERCEVIESDDRPTKDLPKANVLYKDYVTFKERRGEHAPSLTRWGAWMVNKYEKVSADGVRYRGLRLKPLEADTVE